VTRAVYVLSPTVTSWAESAGRRTGVGRDESLVPIVSPSDAVDVAPSAMMATPDPEGRAENVVPEDVRAAPPAVRVVPAKMYSFSERPGSTLPVTEGDDTGSVLVWPLEITCTPPLEGSAEYVAPLLVMACPAAERVVPAKMYSPSELPGCTLSDAVGDDASSVLVWPLETTCTPLLEGSAEYIAPSFVMACPPAVRDLPAKTYAPSELPG
jgi:hypothetical protein